MDVASLMTGIVIGSAVCGVIGFVVGLAMGGLSGRCSAVQGLWKDLFRDAAVHLEHEEMYSVHLNIIKQFVGEDDEGGGDEEMEPLPDGSVRFGRN